MLMVTKIWFIMLVADVLLLLLSKENKRPKLEHVTSVFLIPLLVLIAWSFGAEK